MSKVIAKGNYVKGASGVSKAHAHIKYIEHRPGRDKDDNERAFFSDTKDEVSRSEIRDHIDSQDPRYAVMHRIVLSPGINDTDLKEFTRETMQELSDRKGQPLSWYAIDHRNTDHSHVHVCVMGQDKEGGLVRLNTNDYRAIRAAGDVYMDREHGLDRYLDSEGQRVLDSKEYKTLDKKWLNKEIERFEYGSGKDRERSERALRDRMEWEQLDKELRKTFSDQPRGDLHRMTCAGGGFLKQQRDAAPRQAEFGVFDLGEVEDLGEFVGAEIVDLEEVADHSHNLATFCMFMHAYA